MASGTVKDVSIKAPATGISPFKSKSSWQNNHSHGVQHVQEVLGVGQVRGRRDWGSAGHVLVDGSSDSGYLVKGKGKHICTSDAAISLGFCDLKFPMWCDRILLLRNCFPDSFACWPLPQLRCTSYLSNDSYNLLVAHLLGLVQVLPL